MTASLCLDEDHIKDDSHFNEINGKEKILIRTRSMDDFNEEISQEMGSELREILKKIKELKMQLKDFSQLGVNKRIYSKIAENPHLLVCEMGDFESKQVFIENLNHSEQLSLDWEESNSVEFYSQEIKETSKYRTYTPRTAPVFEKYITYANEIKNNEFDKRKIKEMRDIATDTNDLVCSEKFCKSEASNEMQTEESEPNNPKEDIVKIKNAHIIKNNAPARKIRINTVYFIAYFEINF